MSRSPRKVAGVALEIGNRTLPQYAHKFSPKKFTQPQLFACLVLKRFFDVDYRGIQAYLGDMPSLQQELGLKKVPHFTTLQQAHARLLGSANTRKLLDQSVRLVHEAEAEGQEESGAEGSGDTEAASSDPPPPREVPIAAGDSTGLDATRRSKYYTRRLKQTSKGRRKVAYRRFPKLGFVCDIKRHMYLSVKASRGPRPDVAELVPLLDDLPPSVWVRHVLFDAGYDSEANHRYAREEHGILTTIPPWIGRPSDKPPTGKYRRMMKETWGLRKYYGQRWQAEATISMTKRRLGDRIEQKDYHAQRRETHLLALTHNVCVLMPRGVLYRALPTPFLSPTPFLPCILGCELQSLHGNVEGSALGRTNFSHGRCSCSSGSISSFGHRKWRARAPRCRECRLLDRSSRNVRLGLETAGQR